MTAAMDGMVRLWDPDKVDNSREAIMLRPGQARQGGASTAHWGKKEGQWLLTGSKDAYVKIWDWQRKSIRPAIAIESAHGAGAMITSLCLLSDEQTLVSRATDDTLKGLFSLLFKCLFNCI